MVARIIQGCYISWDGKDMRVLNFPEHAVLVQVPPECCFLVDKRGGGVVAAPIFPRGEGQEVDVAVADATKGGVDGGKL